MAHVSYSISGKSSSRGCFPPPRYPVAVEQAPAQPEPVRSAAKKARSAEARAWARNAPLSVSPAERRARLSFRWVSVSETKSSRRPSLRDASSAPSQKDFQEASKEASPRLAWKRASSNGVGAPDRQWRARSAQAAAGSGSKGAHARRAAAAMALPLADSAGSSPGKSYRPEKSSSAKASMLSREVLKQCQLHSLDSGVAEPSAMRGRERTQLSPTKREAHWSEGASPRPGR